MKEIDFQVLFELYHRNEKGSVQRKRALEDMHRYVYSYPIRRFKATRESASEFYSENFEKIEKLFQEYDPKYNISFTIYVSYKLKTAFFNFVKKEKDKITESNINVFYEIDPDEHYMKAFGKIDEREEEQARQTQQLVLDNIASLDMEERTVIKLHYGFPLSLSDFRFIRARRKGHHVIKAYRVYLETLREHFEKEKIHKERLFERLVRLDIAKRKNNLYVFDNKQDYLINQYQSMERGIKLKVISEVVNENITYVHRKIKTAKVKLAQKLQNENTLYWRQNKSA